MLGQMPEAKQARSAHGTGRLLEQCDPMELGAILHHSKHAVEKIRRQEISLVRLHVASF